jgi:hypothetical protein
LHLDKKNPGLKATMLFSDEATWSITHLPDTVWTKLLKTIKKNY